MTNLKKKIRSLHREEGGAIFVLLLAAFLILFMVGMTLFDTGVAAGDKVSVQVAADTASFSHTVVKARSMNVIVYANIIKRMYYSYMSTYVNAWAAILLNLADAASSCSIPWGIASCIEAIDTGLLILLEGIEFIVTNAPTLGFDFGGQTNFSDELVALDNYSRYMHAITPWWAYIESVARGATNGAVATATWPPPPTRLDSVKSGIASVASGIDSVFQTKVMDKLPSYSKDVDTLPIDRRDRAGDIWSVKFGPFKARIGSAGFIDGARYCKSYGFSYEYLLHGLQTYIKGKESGLIKKHKWRPKFLLLELVPVLGCLGAHQLYKNEGYLDWRVVNAFAEDTGTKAAWSKSTGNVALAYRPKAGRMDNDAGRQKFQYLDDPKYDHQNKNTDYLNEGYFAMSRSELVYKQPFDVLNNLNWSGPIGSFASNRLGTQKAPDMWSPRWKAKGRPMLVPGESMGSSIHKNVGVGMQTVINDSVPLLILSSVLGVFNNNFSFASAGDDLAYILRVGQDFNADRFSGVPK